MPENVLLMEEDRGFINKAKSKMEQLRKSYKEKYIDTGKSQAFEQKIDDDAKRTKRAIKIAGTLATVVLFFCPADGPFGEFCTALATPGLCALVDLAADIKKKSIITGKRGLEKHFLRVDGSNGNIDAYDLTNNEIIEDFGSLLKKADNFYHRSI